MKCKKHGEAPAEVIECPFCGIQHRFYKDQLGALEALRCRSCGGAFKKGDIIYERATEKTCDGCGMPFCDDCLMELRGKYYCEKCASDLINKYERGKERKDHLEREKAEGERLKRIEEQQIRAVASTKKSKSGCGCVLTIIVSVVVTAIVMVAIIAL